MDAVIAGTAPLAVDVEAGKTYYWCACGRSANQPFCDGSHKGTGLRSLAYTAAETTTVYFCACKRTATQPLCDGAHEKLDAAPPA